MPHLVRGPLREVRSRVFDSARWERYRPRPDDIIIATYPKCGTTWMQRIVGMLIFQTPDPFPVQDYSPWFDMRVRDLDEVTRVAEMQTHRRFLKTHLPYDAMPIYQGVKFIHVARDGRDAAMSFHNHKINYTPFAVERMSQITLADPKFGRPYAPADPDPARHFHDWIAGDEDAQGDPGASFFHIEKSFWAERRHPDVLLVHHADLKRDLAGEMRRIAAYLGIAPPEAIWPALVEAAGFDAMKRDALRLMPHADRSWRGGATSFLHKGTNGRWRGVVSEEDLELYQNKVRTEFSPALAKWVEQGMSGAGNPRTAPD